jgi:hypothetical protein
MARTFYKNYIETYIKEKKKKKEKPCVEVTEIRNFLSPIVCFQLPSTTTQQKWC